MYLFIVFKDIEQTIIIFVGLFDRITDIIQFSGNLLRYSDIDKKKKIFKTYKDLFKVIKC